MKRTSEIAMYCPVCTKGKVIVAANQREAERIRLVRPQNADRASCFTKCRSCGSQIGMEFQRTEPETTQIPIIGRVTP